jgi:hypothetical protein
MFLSFFFPSSSFQSSCLNRLCALVLLRSVLCARETHDFSKAVDPGLDGRAWTRYEAAKLDMLTWSVETSLQGCGKPMTSGEECQQRERLTEYAQQSSRPFRGTSLEMNGEMGLGERRWCRKGGAGGGG